MVISNNGKYEIHTPRLTLVPHGIKYLDSTQEYTANPELTRYMFNLHNKTLEDTRQFLLGAERDWNSSNQQNFEFAVLCDGRHIGGVSVYINQDCPNESELGWMLLKEYHGKGYATEAALGLKEFAFETLGLNKIYAHCDARNDASRRVMEKIGMNLERNDGERYDQFMGEKVKELTYSLKREDDIIAETERLLMKKFDESMAEAVHLLSLDGANRRFQPDEVFETVEDACKTIQYLAANYGNPDAPQVYPIVLKETRENIGHVELVPLGGGEWEIGYHIGEKFTRQGYASEAVAAFLPVIMKKWHLSQVWGICDAENIGSRGVMEKCGFTKEFEGVGIYHGEQRKICRYQTH